MSKVFGSYSTHISQALKLSLPIITGQLGMVLMGFFDTMQMGAVGPVEMAATGLANGVFFTILLLGIGITFSISPLIAIADGEGHAEKSYGILLSGSRLAAVLSVIFMIIIALVSYRFDILGQTAEVNEMCRTYLNISIYSIPCMLLFNVMKQYFDGLGRTIPAMAVTLIAVLMNVFLNWLLIYGNWGFPALGVAGTAIATLTSRIFMVLAIGVMIYRDKQTRQYKAQYTKPVVKSLKDSESWHIFRMGLPIGLQYFFEIAAFNAAQVMCGWISPKSLAAHQVALQLAAVTYMAITGFAAAGSIMVGNAYGAKNLKDIRMSGNAILILTLLCETAFALVFILFNDELPLLFNTGDAQVVTIAASLLIFGAFFQLSDGFQAVGAGILRGVKDVKTPSAIAFISYWIIMVPLSYLLAFKTSLGISGIWIGFIIGLTIAAVLLIWRFKSLTKNLSFDDSSAPSHTSASHSIH